MDENCMFCQIITGNAKANMIYQDDEMTVFEDIHPVAPIHYLIVPNQHIDSMNEVTEENSQILGAMLLTARNIAKDVGISEDGYRIMINTGDNGRQTVFHLHLHLIGGKKLLGRMAVNG
jgi:histidine triad (HIT) family protein